MLGLFLRKNFYEGWDNVMYFLVPNVIMDVIVALSALFMFLGREFLLVWAIVVLVAFILLSILSLSWGKIACDIVDYKSIEFKDYFKNIPSCIIDGIFLGLFYFAFFVILFFGIQFYFRKEATFAGLFAGCMFCWVAIVIFLAMQWFIPIKSNMKTSFSKTIKKCFILFLDNIAFSLFITLYNLFLTVVSIIMIGVAPGMCGLLFARANAFRILLKKYDYIEQVQKEQNITGKIKIPWKELVKEDNEIVGVRTFKSFFMPWKE